MFSLLSVQLVVCSSKQSQFNAILPNCLEEYVTVDSKECWSGNQDCIWLFIVHTTE